MKKMTVMGAVLLGSFIAVFGVTGGFPRLLRNLRERVPGLEVASLINLGTLENGHVAQVPITLHNHGSDDLSLSRFHTDCACMELYRMEEDVKYRLASLVVKPGEKVTVFADLRVSGNPGHQYATRIWCKTTEPEREDLQIVILYTPVAHLYTVPKVVSFGELLRSSPKTERVELRSDGSFIQPLKGLTSSDPEIFRVSFVPPTDVATKALAAGGTGQHLIGYVDVTLLSGSPLGRLHRQLILFNGADEIVRLPVSAIVVSEIQFSPDTLTLPRLSGGRPSYAAKVICQTWGNRPLRLSFRQEGMPFEVTIARPATSDSQAMITVRYTGDVSVERTKTYELKFSDADGAPRLETLKITVRRTE